MIAVARVCFLSLSGISILFWIAITQDFLLSLAHSLVHFLSLISADDVMGANKSTVSIISLFKKTQILCNYLLIFDRKYFYNYLHLQHKA
jgi:hypothetical protein